MVDSIRTSCHSGTGGFYPARSINRWPLSERTQSLRACFQAYATVVTSAEGADADALGKVDEIKQYPFPAFLQRNKTPLERQGLPQLGATALASSGPCQSSSSWASSSPRSGKPTTWPDSPGEAADSPHPSSDGCAWLPLIKLCREVS